MPKIKPFDGYLVRNDVAARVVAPEYDTVPAAQRRTFADDNPQNFLNAIRLIEDFDPNNPPSQEELIEFNRRNLNRLLAEGLFHRFRQPSLFIYELSHSGHVQTGVVCEISSDEYQQGHIKKHENTRQTQEDLLTQYQKELGVASCPISLAYPADPAIDQFIDEQQKWSPMLDFTTGDQVHQRVWCIEDRSLQQELSRLFESVEDTYLTDGHHRAASGWRYTELMRSERGGDGTLPHEQLLVALFADRALRLLPYHRCVRSLNGLTHEAFLAALANDFVVSVAEDQKHFAPESHGVFGMYLDGTWYRLDIKPDRVDWNDPVTSLDVALLQNHLLEPVCGIHDFRSDPRLGYVTGAEGNAGLEQKVREGWAVSFSCHATSMEQLFRVADAGALMPPKSTYFDPKTRSGVWIRFK